MSLSNIYGNQDAETLENLLNNVPNIVPKIGNLLSRAHNNDKGGAGGEPTTLEAIAENSAPTETARFQESGVDVETADVVVNVVNAGEGFDTVDIGREDSVLQNLSVTRDTHGGYANPTLEATPEEEHKVFAKAATSTPMPGEGEAGGGGKANSSAGMDISEADSVTVAAKVLANGLSAVNRSTPEASRSRSLDSEGGAPRMRTMLHKMASIRDDDVVVSPFEGDHRASTESLDGSTEVLSKPTTLQTFLRNIVEKHEEIVENLSASHPSADRIVLKVTLTRVWNKIDI